MGSMPKKLSSVNQESSPSKTKFELSGVNGSLESVGTSRLDRFSLCLAFSKAALSASALLRIAAPWIYGFCSEFMARSTMSCAASVTLLRHSEISGMQEVNVWHVDRMNRAQKEIMMHAESSTYLSLSF
jgi:hypothetical protein